MWFSSALGRLNETGKSPPRRPQRTCRPGLEVLEDRTVPAPVTVGNLTDVVNGSITSIPNLVVNPGADGISLREALLAANNTAGADTITFQPGLTGAIPLDGGELSVTDSVTLTGPGAGVVAVSGKKAARIFVTARVVGSASALDVTLSGLTLTEGNAGASEGGAIRVGGGEVVTLSGMVIANNTALTGGGIFLSLDGRLTVENSTISGNGGEGAGGGLFLGSNSVALIRNSTLSRNVADRKGRGNGA